MMMMMTMMMGVGCLGEGIDCKQFQYNRLKASVQDQSAWVSCEQRTCIWPWPRLAKGGQGQPWRRL